MKGPNDPLIKAEIIPGNRGRKKKRKPAGGKVLARMKHFALQRNLPLTLGKKTILKPSATSSIPSTSKSKAISDKASKAEKATHSYAKAMSKSSKAVVSPTNFRFEVKRPGSKMRRGSKSSIQQWRFLGPSSIKNGQTYGTSRVICSGRIADVAIDPSDSKHILVGSAGGGVWETKDRGATWEPRTDFMDSLKTGAIAFDRSNPSIVYCGTGEGNEPLGLGQGILLSKDGGTTWALHCREPFVGQDFFDLVVDHLQKGHMLAATNYGIYKSIDGGKTWALSRPDNCWDLVISSIGGMHDPILAACTNGLYESKDGGCSFKKIILPFADRKFERLAVVMSKTNPDKAYAFGVLEKAKKASLWCRTEVDGAWKRYAVPDDIDISQASYDWFLEVSPDNEDEIYIGAVEAYHGILTGKAWNWVKISTKHGDDIHPDHHCIAIDSKNPNNIFIGNDGGLFFSRNRGKDWKSLNAGLGITEINYLAQDLNDPDWLLAGTQDNGSIRYTGKLQWEQVADGDGGDCGVNHASPKICYHTFYQLGIKKSNNKGVKGSWREFGPVVTPADEGIFYPPMEVNGDLVAQAGSVVFLRRHISNKWEQVRLPGGNMGTAMYIPTTDVVYVGSQKGAIYKISWKGTKWSKANLVTRIGPDAFISDLYVDPNNLDRMWATSSAVGVHHCFRSNDGGESWVSFTKGLPKLPLNSIEVDPDDPKRVWVAADVGVYQSINGGNSWKALTKGLPNALACDLLYNPKAKLLRVGLRSRGVWEIDV